MRIKTIEIYNYRNLDNSKVVLNPNINFIVGDNNLGKSNFLDLLNIIFNYKGFSEEDFYKKDKEIKIKLKLVADKYELGYFEDLFNPYNPNEINIIIIQENPDENIEFFHEETQNRIPGRLIRGISYIVYSSGSSKTRDIKFSNSRGVGGVLNNILAQSIKEKEYINETNVLDAIKDINIKLKKISLFDKFNVSAQIDKQNQKILEEIITLKDKNGIDFQKLGYGVQYTLLLVLSIMERLHNKYDKNSKIIYNSNGKQVFPIIMGLDEPEIHLHPFMQRSIIKYLYKLITNKDSELGEFLKELYCVDEMCGQIIIVTHSPNILSSNYKEIIRFCNEKDGLNIYNGEEIKLDIKIEKHLLRCIEYVKEALFCKYAIFVEGDTEFGALPIFAQKLGIDLDEKGIAIVKLNGADSVKQMISLFKKLGIGCLAYLDRDKFSSYKELDEVYFTEKMDFEYDIYEKITFKQYLNYLEEINEKNGYLIGQAIKYQLIDKGSGAKEQFENLSDEKGEILKEKVKDEIISKLKDNKNPAASKIIAEIVDIPMSIKNIFTKLGELI